MIRNKDYLHQLLVVKSWRWYLLMPWSVDKLTPLHPYIYTSQRIRNLLMSEHVSLDLHLEFIHASEHLHQQKQIGIVIWLCTYLCKRSFRVRQEFQAIHEEMRYLKREGFEFDIDKSAHNLAARRGFCAMPFDEAKAQLMAMWSQI